jgi:release factor glutamine methyltransferase
LRSAQALVSEATTRIGATLSLDPASARIEVLSLLSHALDVDRVWILAHSGDPVPEAAAAGFGALLARRLRGEPVGYITGYREFYGLPFRVSPAVLLPRPETEILLEQALARIPERAPCRVLDLGTGSGALAVTIASLRPLAAVTASDACPEALALAAENAAALLVPGAVRFVESDWFCRLESECFDLIISNPPYVAEGDPHLGQGDLRFEPKAALVGGVDGLACIRRIVAQAPAHLNAGGWLLFEHGHDQAATCRNLLASFAFQDIWSVRDLAGIERVSGGRAG